MDCKIWNSELNKNKNIIVIIFTYGVFQHVLGVWDFIFKLSFV